MMRYEPLDKKRESGVPAKITRRNSVREVRGKEKKGTIKGYMPGTSEGRES
jgi:hypothetical protein